MNALPTAEVLDAANANPSPLDTFQGIAEQANFTSGMIFKGCYFIFRKIYILTGEIDISIQEILILQDAPLT